MIGQIRYMMDKGFEVHVASGPGPELDYLVQTENIPVHRLKMKRGLSPLGDFVALLTLYFLCIRMKPAIVHGSTAKGGPLSMLASSLAKIPVRVYTLRGLIIELGSGIMKKVFRALEWLACRCATQIFAVSRSVMDKMVNEKLCDSRKIKVLESGSSMGVDAEKRFNPDRISKVDAEMLRARLGIPAVAIVAGFVGRIVRDKGIMELATAWRKLRREHENIFLLIIGPVEPQDPVPPEVLLEFRTDPRVIIIDFVHNQEMPRYYRIMDFVVLPSYREGFRMWLWKRLLWECRF